MGVPEQYIGKRVKCVSCSEPIIVPESSEDQQEVAALQPQEYGVSSQTLDNEFEDNHPNESSASSVWTSDMFDSTASKKTEETVSMQAEMIFCNSCGKQIERDSVICIHCGHNLKTGQNVLEEKKTAENHSSKKVSPAVATMKGLPIEIGGSLLGALIGGFIWAAIVYFTQYEIGIVAWGIGILSGLGAVCITKDYSVRLGVIAGTMALVGLVSGNVLIYKWVVPSIQEVVAEMVTDEEVTRVASNPENMFYYAYQHMYKNSMLSQDEYNKIDNYEASDDLKQKVYKQIDMWTLSEKEVIAKAEMEIEAEAIGKFFGNNSGLWTVFVANFDIFTALWAIFAIGSAYKIGVGFSVSES